MLWKSLLTGTVLAGLSGTVVYFGSGGEIATAGVKADMQEAVAETKAATKSATHKIGEVAFEAIDKMADASDSVEATIKNQMSSETSEKSEPPKSDSKDKTEKKWLDRYLNKKSEENKSETDEPVDVDELESSDVDGVVKDILKKDQQNPEAEKEEQDEVSPLQKVMTDKEIKAVYETALAETKAITIVELRDRAYLSLIDYTIRNNDFARSKAAVSNISQPELRDTARSNIAVGLARVGKRKAAFAILEDVETKALSDILRLQVIEAMTTPLPENTSDANRTN